MGMFTRGPVGAQVLTLAPGKGRNVEVTCDNYHGTEAGLVELAGNDRRVGQGRARTVDVWLRRNERQRVDVISQPTGERFGRILGNNGQFLNDMFIAQERRVRGPLYVAATMHVTTTWSTDGRDQWWADCEAVLRLPDPLRTTLTPYGA